MRGRWILPSVSEENVEIVRRIWEADRRRDLDAVYATYAPDVVWEDNSGLWGDWGVARGPDGIQEAWRRWHQAFEGVEFDWEEASHDGDHVVVTYRTRGRGRASGLEIDSTLTLVWTLRDGKVVHIRAYTDRDEALGAVSDT
jgi:ketosteroid isomerase-like protein